MKKFLLVTMIGLVLAMDLYGIVNQFMKDEVKEIDHIAESTIMVYVEQQMLFLLVFATHTTPIMERRVYEGTVYSENMCRHLKGLGTRLEVRE